VKVDCGFRRVAAPRVHRRDENNCDPGVRRGTGRSQPVVNILSTNTD